VSEQHPNNWMSHFGGPAWTWDEATGQFYCHSFLREQPDLNWRNPEVREAVYAAMRFWLERGVDGFRMDVLWLLIKDDQFRNNTDAATYNANQPETLEIVGEMRALMDGYGATIGEAAVSNRVLIGEIYLALPELVRYYGEEPSLGGANLPFNFRLIQTAWDAGAIAGVVREYEAVLPAGAWPNYVLGNHDQSRLATRVGPLQARAAAMLLLTLRGTPTLYYGDELGMTDVAIAPWQVRDPAEKNQPGQGKGRDPERSPMLWLDTPNAGFTTAEATPWLPLLDGWRTMNAAVASRDARSMLTLYRRLLGVRRLHDTLRLGAIAEVAAEGSVLRYRRVALPEGESTDFVVLLNLGAEVATVEAPAGTVVLTTLLDGEGARTGTEDGGSAPVVIEAGEGLLIAVG
jgi:alpha-glucosidase